MEGGVWLRLGRLGLAREGSFGAGGKRGGLGLNEQQQMPPPISNPMGA